MAIFVHESLLERMQHVTAYRAAKVDPTQIPWSEYIHMIQFLFVIQWGICKCVCTFVCTKFIRKRFQDTSISFLTQANYLYISQQKYFFYTSILILLLGSIFNFCIIKIDLLISLIVIWYSCFVGLAIWYSCLSVQRYGTRACQFVGLVGLPGIGSGCLIFAYAWIITVQICSWICIVTKKLQTVCKSGRFAVVSKHLQTVCNFFQRTDSFADTRFTTIKTGKTAHSTAFESNKLLQFVMQLRAVYTLT